MKSVLGVHNHAIVIDIELVVWIILLDIIVNLCSDVFVSGLVLVEGVVVWTWVLVHHLVDDIPVNHSELVEVIHRFIYAIVNHFFELGTKDVPGPAGVVPCLGPK